MGFIPTALLKVEREADSVTLYLGSPFWILAVPAALFTAIVIYQGAPWQFIAILWAVVFLYALWRDLWTCSLSEPLVRHTPTLAGLRLGSRSYRIPRATYFRVREYRPVMSFSWPPILQLLMVIPGDEVRVTMSHNETYLTQVEDEMKSALSRWMNSNDAVV
jgi:hypothetical protein